MQFKDEAKSPMTTAKMYVGKYFTENGEFDEVRNLLRADLLSLLLSYYLLILSALYLAGIFRV